METRLLVRGGIVVQASRVRAEDERSMINVLHIGSGNMFGGIERMLVTLCAQRALCPEVVPHVAFAFDDRPAREVRATGTPVHALAPASFSKPWTILKARRALASLLRRERFDAVICHACWPHAIFAPVVRRAKLPLVFWGHDIASNHWLDRWASKTRPDLLLACSAFVCGGWSRNFDNMPGHVVRPPTVITPQQVTPDIRARTRDALSTPQDHVVVVMAARLERWKGHAALTAAMTQLKDVPNWTCWIAGGVQRPEEQAYFDELQQSVREAGLSDRIKLLGQRDDVPTLLGSADVLCQPNTGPEPFGLALVEALAAGLPVVTSDIGGGAEIVTPDTGLLVPPNDIRKLSYALRCLIEDPAMRRQLGSNGPARAVELCDPEAALRRIASLVRPLTSHTRRAASEAVTC